MPAIVALTNGSPHARIIINAVVDRFGPVTVLTEDKEPRGELMWRRLKRHGSMTLVGQIGFVFLQRFIAKRSRVCMAEIIQEQGLNPEQIASARSFPLGR